MMDKLVVKRCGTQYDVVGVMLPDCSNQNPGVFLQVAPVLMKIGPAVAGGFVVNLLEHIGIMPVDTSHI